MHSYQDQGKEEDHSHAAFFVCAQFPVLVGDCLGGRVCVYVVHHLLFIKLSKENLNQRLEKVKPEPDRLAQSDSRTKNQSQSEPFLKLWLNRVTLL